MGVSGQPGQPGEAGQPAVGAHGGAGGTGGHGGHGGHVSRSWFAFLLILIIGLAIGTLILVGQVKHATTQVHEATEKLAALERKDAQEQRENLAAQAAANRRQDLQIEATREAAWRICVRQVNTRAVVLLDANGDEPTAQLPLYDCLPNLSGRPATVLSPAQQRAYLHHVQTAKTLP